jgi:acetyl-CoA carboxylase biotin carboxylase subunit
MFKKVLVANRGEIALRVIRACKELGIPTVAVHSTGDPDSLHVRFADEDVCIGGSHSSESYLNISRIISAAEITGADAIHPGYGFLSENDHFAEVCESCNIHFIGPTAEMIRSMGDKALARQIMQAAGVPVIPGSEGVVGSVEEADGIAAEIGFPLMIKAKAGGGGRGMRMVRKKAELAGLFRAAQGEAEAAFGNPQLYIERLVERPRHVEVQVVGDSQGNKVHLGERDCSIQRRHQKLVEESPSPAVDEKLRRKLGETAVKAMKAVDYSSVGTIEFLLDQDGRFYFMEMNTRIQVEHPVTEMVTGFDLIKEQIRIAAGEPLSFSQEQVVLDGHAIECRINAEDPDNKFAPSPGFIKSFHAPGGPGIRVDTHIYAGYTIPPYYDSMIAKVIVHGHDRPEALARMSRALEELVVEGIKTTVPFHRRLLSKPKFIEGDYDTSFIERLDDG